MTKASYHGLLAMEGLQTATFLTAALLTVGITTVNLSYENCNFYT